MAGLSSFDQVSILGLKGKVDTKLFFELCGQMAVRDYMRLEKIIKLKIDDNPKNLHHFKTLRDQFSQRTDLRKVVLY